VPLDSWVCPWFEELRLRQGGPAFPVMTGPFERRSVAAWLIARPREGASRRSAWLAGILGDEMAPEIALAEGGGRVFSVDARAGLLLEEDRRIKPGLLLTVADLSGRGLSLWTSLRLTGNWPDAHAVKTRPWREQGRASFDYGGLGWRRGRWSLFVGRDRLAWSSTHGLGLLLGAEAPALDMLKLTVSSGHLVLTAVHSQLRDGYQGWPTEINRYLSGHRLEALIGSRLTLSVSEAVVYGGFGRGIEFGYLNPLAAFYADQWNGGRDDNLLVGGDAALLFPGRAEVRAEVMFDDFQIDPGSEPHKMALGIGAMLVGPIRPEAATVGFTYCLATNRTYGHREAYNRFVQEGRVMGLAGGPDSDRLEVWARISVSDPVEVRLAYLVTRRGEGRLEDPQLEPGPSLRFPSGTVESVHSVGAQASWRPSRALEVRAAARWQRTLNAGNRDGDDRDEATALLELAYGPRWFRVVAGAEQGSGASAPETK